jgi:hypothetical protein
MLPAAMGGASLLGYLGNKEAAKDTAAATRYAAELADPFREQRPYYQNILKMIYSGEQPSSEGGRNTPTGIGPGGGGGAGLSGGGGIGGNFMQALLQQSLRGDPTKGPIAPNMLGGLGGGGV